MTLRRTASCLATAALVVAAAAAQAVAADSLRIDTVDAGKHPRVELTVTAPESLAGKRLGPESFTISENGRAVAARVAALPSDNLAVLLLVDTSGSMSGAPMEAAKSAAADFIDQMPAGVRISVVGFGTTPSVEAGFTTDHARAASAVQSLEARGETALYDAVLTAGRQFPKGRSLRRALVLLSDGGDTVSRATLNEAAASVGASRASTHVVELKSPESDSDALVALAKAGNGTVVRTTDPAQLAALYDSVAAELVNRYVLRFRSEAYGPTELLTAIDSEGVRAEATKLVQFPPPPPAKPAPPSVRPGEVLRLGWIAEPWVPAVGAAVVFAGLAVLLLTVLAPRRRRRALVEDRPAATAGEKMPTIATVTAYLVRSADQLLERRGKTRSLNNRLEQAGVNLRPAEYVVLSGCAMILTFATLLLFAGPWVALIAAVGAGFAVRTYINIRIARRRAAFSEQLGDTLQLLAGSLRAGYGLMQAVDAVSREADEPTGEEFRRLVVETRLGRDFSDSLQAMADRLGTEDFTWVVQAMEIHREVGGDLAEVLDAVAGTIRERDQIRRQVKALSAEGRLSAVILLGLPFFMAAAISVLQPGYLQELFRHPVGWAMVITSGILMTVGTIWVRRLVRLVF